jgi:hypothetical protein
VALDQQDKAASKEVNKKPLEDKVTFSSSSLEHTRKCVKSESEMSSVIDEPPKKKRKTKTKESAKTKEKVGSGTT